MGTHSTHARNIRRFLQGNTFLGRLPDVALDTLIERGQLRKFSKRDSIYQRGEPGDSLMVVVSKATAAQVPGDIRMKMLVLHAPEQLGLKQEYIQEHQAGLGH